MLEHLSMYGSGRYLNVWSQCCLVKNIRMIMINYIWVIIIIVHCIYVCICIGWYTVPIYVSMCSCERVVWLHKVAKPTPTGQRKGLRLRNRVHKSGVRASIGSKYFGYNIDGVTSGRTYTTFLTKLHA